MSTRHTLSLLVGEDTILLFFHGQYETIPLSTVDMVNTSFSMETTTVIWFLDMVTVTVLRKNMKRNGRSIDNMMFMCTRKWFISGSSDCYHRALWGGGGDDLFCKYLYKKHSNLVFFCYFMSRKVSRRNETSFYQIWSTYIHKKCAQCTKYFIQDKTECHLKEAL